jgi:hypothetical protein
MKSLEHNHQEMRAVSHHHIAMAIEMSSDGGTFIIVAASFV